MFIVVYRPHGRLNCETQHIGPFLSHDAAYDALCEMPALGSLQAGQHPGVKFTEELRATFADAQRELDLSAALGANWTMQA